MAAVGLCVFGLAGLVMAATPDDLQAASALIVERYGAEIDEEALWAAALEGMTRHVDAATGTRANALITAEEAERRAAWRSGERQGIGVEFRIVAGRGLVITDVFAGGPAAAAGLRVGELVTGLDGRSFSGRSGTDIHAAVSGITTLEVVLWVAEGKGDAREVGVTRGAYRRYPTRAEGERPYVRLPFFGARSAEELEALLADLDPDQPLVVDLRDNNGGLLDEMVAAAGLFLDEGVVVVERVDPAGHNEPQRAQTARRWTGPVVILANRGTAGPAEGFIAALTDHRVAQVVGTPTGGDDGLTGDHALPNGLVLQLVEARLRSPLGRSWGGTGLTPDLLVEPIQMVFARPGTPPDDLQRDAAVRLISSP